jgi:glycerophosphoryl diester phosphodiesterase
MKDIETIIPFLREFLDERGLKDVNFTVVLDKVDEELINQTYTNEIAKVETLYSNRVFLEKTVKIDTDTIIFQSNIFNQ